MLLPIFAPFFSRAMTAEVFLQPTARSRGRIPLQSTCSTDAPWSTRYCTWTRIKATFFTTFINSLHYIALCSGCRTGRTGNCSKLTNTIMVTLAVHTTSGSPQNAARSRGVRPLRSAWVVAAPLSTSSLTNESWPFRHAQLSAVSPSLSVCSREAPGSRQIH